MFSSLTIPAAIMRQLDRIVTALEVASRSVEALSIAALMAAKTFKQINAELGAINAKMEECSECNQRFANEDLLTTTWDARVCRACWDGVTNGAPLPD